MMVLMIILLKRLKKLRQIKLFLIQRIWAWDLHLKPVFKKHIDLDFTFDIGHANILYHTSNHRTAEEKIYSMLDSFKNNVEHVHIHDNLGGFNESADRHLPIGTGIINFSKFFSKLREINYTKTVTIEVPNPKYQTIYLEASFKVVKNILAEIDH